LDTHKRLNHTAKLTKLLKNLYKQSSLADHTCTLTELVISRCKLDNDCHHILDVLKISCKLEPPPFGKNFKPELS
jgi:hypothetical protein